MKKWIPSIGGLIIIGFSAYLSFLTDKVPWMLGIILGIIIIIGTIHFRTYKSSVRSGKEETE